MKRNDTFRFVAMALLIALVAVLQFLGGSISFGGFSITLVLIPVVIGSAMFGAGNGALLGGVFGVIVFYNCAIGADIGGNMVFVANPLLCAAVCIGKGILAGYAAGMVYRWISGNEAGQKTLRNYIAVFAAAIVAPVVNTGTFILGMLLFFRETLDSWAGGTPIVSYIILGLTGINFLIELGVNLVFAPGVTTLLQILRNRR